MLKRNKPETKRTLRLLMALNPRWLLSLQNSDTGITMLYTFASNYNATTKRGDALN